MNTDYIWFIPSWMLKTISFRLLDNAKGPLVLGVDAIGTLRMDAYAKGVPLHSQRLSVILN